MGDSASDLERDLRKAAATGEPLDLGDRPNQEVRADVLYRVLAGDSAPAPRAVKLREQRELVEQIKLERLADRPTPRRRRRGRYSRAFGMREPFERRYPVDAPARPAPVAPTRVRPANEQQALERGLTGPHWLEDKPRPFDAGRYKW